MRGARVEQRRRRREVRERGDEPVEADGFFGVLRKPARHAHEEVLRGLDDLAGVGVAQQVAVVDRAQTEELEETLLLGVDRVVELAEVERDEVERRCRRRARDDARARSTG